MESLNCKREHQLDNYSKGKIIQMCLLSYNTHKVKVASCLASEISINFVLKIITVFNGSGDIQRQKRSRSNHRLLQTDILRQNYIFMAHRDDQQNWFSAGSILLLRNKFVSLIVELTRQAFLIILVMFEVFKRPPVFIFIEDLNEFLSQ
ncbi:Hypothetical_protein [Hexamita inflata]|uniref:Hypothetical_protein n=1 Tax=Hexamita inflata TaxID=28002 RepID=A0AA86UCV9_9EUKA|nr:Hypothetical protein HINF_LOCUS40695 [Hexamita inflata]